MTNLDLRPMRTRAVRTGRDDWRTPPAFLELVKRDILGGEEFAFDAAASPENAVAPNFCTRDGQRTLWRSWTWCNPPYTLCGEFVHWANSQAVKSILLIPPRTDQAWWAEACEAEHVLFVRKRVNFVPPPGVQGSSSPDPSVLLVFGWVEGLPKIGVFDRDQGLQGGRLL